MHTEVLAAIHPPEWIAAVEHAASLLRKGEVVALPTETVYGLAGDASNPIAIARIFEAKDRPHFDPLIVHIFSREQVATIATIPPGDLALVERLITRYWPGPLTLLLPKKDSIPDLVTSGSPLVAIRMPAHPVFRAVLEVLEKPLAAPSANLFGRISPTQASHVLGSLGGRIPLILDGGPSGLGIESTIVGVHGEQIEILREGPITREELEDWGQVSGGRNSAAPGQLASHYAPSKSLRLIDDPSPVSPDERAISGLLAFQKAPPGFGHVEILSETGDLREAAARLFGCLHRLDDAPVSHLFAEKIPNSGLGRAIMDRLSRASSSNESKPTADLP